MSILVTDTGFAADDFAGTFIPLDQIAANAMPPTAVHLPSDAPADALAGMLDGIAAVRVDFPGFADGRGFTIARRLREMGFAGRLRAHGHVIADQYAMARRSGFDEVAISDDLAARQPQDQWLARADWRAHDYQARLRGQGR